METLDYQSLVAEMGMESFKSASIFGALSEEATCMLLSQGRILALADGEELFHAGDPGDSFYIVLKGRFNYVWQGKEGEVLLRSAGFGEQLGYVSMIGLIPRVGVGRAEGPTVVLEVSSELFFRFHEALPFDFGIIMLNLARDMSRLVIFLSNKVEGAWEDRHPT